MNSFTLFCLVDFIVVKAIYAKLSIILKSISCIYRTFDINKGITREIEYIMLHAGSKYVFFLVKAMNSIIVASKDIKEINVIPMV